MIDDQAALTVADLCEINHIDIDDHSNMGFVDEDDDDSFLANSSLCKQHRSTMQMLDSLRKEVVEMTRSENKYVTPKKSPQDVTIDLNSSTELSSPLISPLLSRTIISVSNKHTLIPNFSNHKMTPHKCDTDHPRHYTNGDDSTFCSMDHSIDNEMNTLKEVVMHLERELKAENVNTVFEAIERIGKSDDPTINGLLKPEEKDFIREGIFTELLKKEQLNKPTILGLHLLDASDFFQIIEIYSMNIKILIASIFLCLIRTYFSSWQR